MSEEIKCAWKSLEGCLCPEAEQQLQTAKEENEKLIILSESLNVENQKQYEKIQSLTQKLGKARKALRLACISLQHDDTLDVQPIIDMYMEMATYV